MTQRRLEHWVAFYHRWVKDADKLLTRELQGLPRCRCFL